MRHRPLRMRRLLLLRKRQVEERLSYFETALEEGGGDAVAGYADAAVAVEGVGEGEGCCVAG